MRLAVTVALLAGCGVEIGGGREQPRDSSTPDTRPSDASIDATPDARPCTGGDAMMTAGGQCYLLFTTPRSWANASTACMGLSARLAVLDTAAKHTVAKTLAGMRDAWIGLSDSATEMQFRWVDATPFSFTAWDPTEPNNASNVYEEDCVLIAGARGGDWDDRPCSDQVPNAPVGSGLYAYICQY